MLYLSTISSKFVLTHVLVTVYIDELYMIFLIIPSRIRIIVLKTPYMPVQLLHSPAGRRQTNKRKICAALLVPSHVQHAGRQQTYLRRKNGHERCVG